MKESKLIWKDFEDQKPPNGFSVAEVEEYEKLRSEKFLHSTVKADLQILLSLFENKRSWISVRSNAQFLR